MKYLIGSFIGLVLSVSVGAESLLEGRVRLSSGQPAIGAQVRLFDLTDLRRFVGTTTDETGHFALSLRALSTARGTALPTDFALGQNYPNPFNPSTIIPYQLPMAAHVRLEVFNLLGQRLATLVDGVRSAGVHMVQWDATDAAGRAVGAGVYIYRLSVGDQTATRRMVLVDGQAGIPAAQGLARAAVQELVEADGSVYGLTVSGEGLVAYVNPAFRMGIDEADIVIEEHGGMPSMKLAAGGLLGDVNNDGQVDISDVLYLLLYLNSTGKCNRLGSWHRKGQLVYFPWPFQTQLPTEALMGTYHQLTEHQRYQIYALKKAGHSQQSIAATVAVSPSTICRELRRNQGQRGYRPGQAHHKALARRRHKAKATKMTAAVIERIEAGLGQQWSPEQIAGRLATTDGFRLSPQRIYQHIQADRQAGGMLYRHLRHSQKKRKKRYGKADARGQIKGRISIDQRPAIVEEKSRIGDWEIDLVMGRARTGALVSVVERRSRYTVLGKVPSKQAEHVAAATIALLAAHKGHTQTITADNGKEFAHHATISQALDAAVYFAHPYHAWERGLNENTNGLIRQYVPKGTALDTLSQAQVHHIMERLNHRPRKGLAFQTPHEILCKETEVQPKQGEIALTS